jgi:hypothetical protein
MKRTPQAPERLSGEAGLRTYIPQKIFLNHFMGNITFYANACCGNRSVEMQYDEAIVRWQIK